MHYFTMFLTSIPFIFIFYAIASSFYKNINWRKYFLYISTIFHFVRMNLKKCIISYFDIGYMKSCQNSYDLHYFFNGYYYKIRFPQEKKMMRRIIRFQDENDNIINSTILTYAGPFLNFHHIPTTPKLLGYKVVKVNYKLGNKQKIFNENDIIKI